MKFNTEDRKKGNLASNKSNTYLPSAHVNSSSAYQSNAISPPRSFEMAGSKSTTRTENAESTTQSQDYGYMNYLSYLITTQGKDIEEIKCELAKYSGITNESEKLLRLLRWILLLLPLAQIAVSIMVIFVLLREAAPIGAIYTILGLVGLTAVAEILFVPKKLLELEKKIEDIDKRIKD